MKRSLYNVENEKVEFTSLPFLFRNEFRRNNRACTYNIYKFSTMSYNIYMHPYTYFMLPQHTTSTVPQYQQPASFLFIE